MAQQITSLLDDPTQTVSLDTFSGLTKGCPAPFWLFQGVCGAWGIDHSRAQLNLITVSENATFLLLLDGEPQGVVRVSQPGYVGGPEAVASEISWLNALHDIDGISLINPVPTVRGTFVTKINDLNGIGWTVISTKYVGGTVLEDLDNPAPYYETIGQWAAKFHEQSRNWNKPYGFTRFNWDLSNMVGPAPRWGRWESANLTDDERALCDTALWKAMDVVMKVPRTNDTWGLIHAAPGKAFIQQMRERWSLSEIPFPATLAGKGFGEVRQVRRFVRGDNFRFYTLAIMGEKGLGYGFANLLMGNSRQQFGQIGHAGTYRRNAFRRQFLFIRVEIVCQAAKVGIE